MRLAPPRAEIMDDERGDLPLALAAGVQSVTRLTCAVRRIGNDIIRRNFVADECYSLVNVSKGSETKTPTCLQTKKQQQTSCVCAFVETRL